MTTTADLYAMPLEDQCEAIWQATLAEERRLQAVRDTPPAMFIFDGNQQIQHILLDCIKLQCGDVENDTGSIVLEFPYEHPVAQWMADFKGRMTRGEGEGMHIDVEKDGVRLSGRADSTTISWDKRKGVMRVTFLTDYENLKWIDCWSNPFLPFIFQFPRIFLLAGPAIWCLKTALFVNLWRIYTSLWQIPDDPMNPTTWLDGLDMSSWDIVVAPTTYLEDLAAGTTWCFFVSRWGKWHDKSAAILADSELSVVTRRYRHGDPEPWPGADLKDGALVVDIVDKSGQMEGVANGGSIFDGFTRTAREYSADFIEQIDNELAGPIDFPTDMFTDMLRTPKGFPLVHFPAGSDGVETEFTTIAAKGATINTGGHSAPGVNEVISAGVQAAGDIIGHNLGVAGYGVGPFGGVLDAVLAPFYTDTVLAWISVKLPWRIAQMGSSHYLEFHIDLPGKAYTLSSVMAIRSAIVATARKTSATITFSNSGPYIVGWPGTGHIYKGDRGSFEILGDTTGEIHVERVQKCSLSWEVGHFAQWEAEFGRREDQDPVASLMKSIAEIASAAHELGVF